MITVSASLTRAGRDPRRVVPGEGQTFAQALKEAVETAIASDRANLFIFVNGGSGDTPEAVTAAAQALKAKLQFAGEVGVSRNSRRPSAYFALKAPRGVGLDALLAEADELAAVVAGAQ